MNTSRLVGVVAALVFTAHSALALDIDALRQQSQSFFKPLPKTMPNSDNDSADKIALGKKLYFDMRLSVNNSQSCNSCHNLDTSNTGVDNLPVSPGAVKGKHGTRNAPTDWNAGLQFVQFWDGRAADLKEQAKGPILNPVEMAMPSEEAVLAKLKKVGYQAAFNKVYGPNGLSYDHLADAIAAFERTLISDDRFDDFLAGDNKALSQAELEGLQNFINTGCIACHNGALFGGQMYQKLGLVNPYPNAKDLGRYEVTHNEADKMVFKVPILRGVGQTAPYFHDGSVKTLEQAVRDMAWYQLGKKLDEKTAASIAVFLHSLDNQRKL